LFIKYNGICEPCHILDGAKYSNTDSNTVSVIDTARLQEIKQIQVPAGPMGIVYVTTGKI
jgi:YVTN family beta-propeller protein